MAEKAVYASASLYVGDLVPEVTEALLYEIFNTVGPVASVRVCRDAATRRSLGYAYVNFHRVEDAERALDTMMYKPIRGKPCRIMWSHRDPSLRKSGQGNIFVKNLAKSVDNKSLYDTFSMFGNILSCKVATNAKGESLGYGFVHYENDEAAANAIQRVDGKMIAERKVTVSAFKSRKERGATKNTFTNIYIKNVPLDWSTEKLQETFAKYGTIQSCVIQQDQHGKSRGFGFVAYNAPEEAAAAVDSLNDTDVGAGPNKKLYVVRAQRKEEREKELREKFEQLKVERQKQYAGVNLYVKNLSDDIDDNRLREEFQKFGDITSSRVMRDEKKSKGFGFVCFSTPEEATKAVTEMNGKMLDGKPLYVALAQRKDVRRLQLEAQHAQRSKIGAPLPQAQMYGGVPPTPVFYPNVGPRQGFMYPQQMVPRGQWPGSQQPGPPMMRHPANIGYQLLPAVQNRGGRGGPTGPAARGGRGGRGGAGRNGAGERGQKPVQTPPSDAQGADAMVGGGQIPSQEPLTIKALAAAPDEQRKQMIGERLYGLIHAQEPAKAGKITGMLLEMDNGELLHLLESQQALTEKITEALQVLADHE